MERNWGHYALTMEENTHQQGSKHGYLKSEGIRHEHTANYLRNRSPSRAVKEWRRIKHGMAQDQRWLIWECSVVNPILCPHPQRWEKEARFQGKKMHTVGIRRQDQRIRLLTLGACARVTVLGLSFVHSLVRSFCPSSCRDHRSLLKLGKGINRLSMTMACNVTRGFC